MKECEDLVLEFVKKWTPPRKCPLGGNSIGQVRIHFTISILDPHSISYIPFLYIDITSIPCTISESPLL